MVSNGWNNIKQVIRHKVDKKVYWVNTPSGSVCITEDHSLIDHLGNKIKPTECTPFRTKLFATWLINEPLFKVKLDKILADIVTSRPIAEQKALCVVSSMVMVLVAAMIAHHVISIHSQLIIKIFLFFRANEVLFTKSWIWN